MIISMSFYDHISLMPAYYNGSHINVYRNGLQKRPQLSCFTKGVVMTIELEFMYEVRAEIGEPQIMGKTPAGIRIMFPVLGGTLRGPALNAEVLPGTSGDWTTLRPDGSTSLDVRTVCKAENGDLIYCTYGGRMHAETKEGIALASDMSKPDPEVGKDQYYLRINPLYETASETYGWLNKVVAVGTGQTGSIGQGSRGLVYQVYQVK